MKNLTSLSDKSFFKIWIFYHIFVLLIFLLVFFLSGMKIKIDTDLFYMIPKPAMEDAISAVDEKLTKNLSGNMFILVSNEDFDKAKEAATALYEKIAVSPKFEKVVLFRDMSEIGEVMKFVQQNRLNLLGDETVSLLESDGGPLSFSQNSLSRAYGAFTMMNLSSLSEDPFMLGEAALENYLLYLQSSGTSMVLKDGVLSAHELPYGISGVDSPRWYVMIQARLSNEGSALASRTNGVALVHKFSEELETDGTRFIFSGTPFHSYKASSNASKEIGIISTVSLLAVLAILLFVFRSPTPILMSFFSIGISVLTAFMSTICVFGKMHVLTLVFGTSLIGSCIDYSLHYFINWKGNAALNSGREIRSRLFRGFGLSMLSTAMCYLALLFAPFGLLKQMAVFSAAGIFSTFLTALCIYPLIKIPEGERKIPLLSLFKNPLKAKRKIFSSFGIVFLFAFCISVFIFTSFGKQTEKSGGLMRFFRIENNLSRLYKMSGKEFSDEAEASQILKYSPSAFFIVSGNSVQEVLENEEKLTASLKIINQGKEKGGYICASGFVPSINRQKKSRKAAEKLLPYAKSQLLNLGYLNDEADFLSEKIRENFSESENDFIEIGKNVPAFLESALSSVWLGKIGEKYYSAMIPVSVTDYEAYKNLSDGKNIFIISKVQEISKNLDRLSATILMFFIAVYVVIFVILKLFYGWREVIRIISVPILIVLSVFAVFAVLKIKLEFFSITGMILVFGLGLDYIIYMVENERRKNFGKPDSVSRLEFFAVALSFVTTAISFGALAFSKFVPVQMLGLSIFIGLSAAFLCTIFYSSGTEN